MPKRDISDAVKNLQVDKAEFDVVLKKLIATPPIRKEAVAARIQREGPGPKPGIKSPRRLKPSR